MNIFYTSRCPIQAADNLCYRHIVKMILEGCQMLSTAHHVLESELDITLIYKSTHKNHPSNIWARSSIDQYEWLWLHTKRMCELYTSHTDRMHASERVLDLLVGYPTGIDDNGLSGCS